MGKSALESEVFSEEVRGNKNKADCESVCLVCMWNKSENGLLRCYFMPNILLKNSIIFSKKRLRADELLLP